MVAKPRKLASGKWQARYTGPDGIRRSAGVFPSRKLAEEAQARAIADISRGVWTNENAGDVLFKDYVAEVLEARKGELTGTSWKNYEAHVRLRLVPYFGKYRMRDIRPTMVRRWWATVNCSPQTRRNSYMALSVIFKYAIDDDIVKASPCRVRGAGKDVSNRRPELTMGDFWRLYDAADEDFKVFLLVIMDGGLRIGEVSGLNRKHFDPKTGRLTIEQQFKYEPGGMVLEAGTKTTDEGRSLTLSPDTTAELADYLKQRPAIGDVPIFTSKTGHRISRKTVWEKWRKLRAEVGLEWAHIHDLRHTGLSAYRRAGATEKDVMERAGHKDPRSMLRYQHTNVEQDAENAARMGEALKRKRA